MVEQLEREYSVEINELGPCKKLMRIAYDGNRVRSEIDANYRDLARRVHLKGFRRGKAPRRTLERLYGSDVLDTVKQKLIYESFEAAIADANLELISQPEPTDIAFDRETGLSYEVTLLLRPSFELPSTDGLKVEVEPLRVSDEELNGALAELGRRSGEVKDAGDEAVIEEGDEVTCDVEIWLSGEFEAAAAAEGEEVDAAEGEEAEGDDEDDGDDEVGGLAALKELEGVTLKVSNDDSQLVAGVVVKALADDLLGHSVGDDSDVDVVLPPDYEVIEGRNEPAVMRLHITGIQRLEHAPVDDALAKEQGYDNLEDLRTAVRDQLLDRRSDARDGEAGDEIVAELFRRIGPLDLPQDLVDSELQKKQRQHLMRCRMMGMSEEQSEKELVEKEDELRVEAMNELKRFFLLDALARKEKIEVPDEELQGAVSLIARQIGRPVAEFQRELKEHPERLGEIRWSLTESKVLTKFRKNAEIVDKTS